MTKIVPKKQTIDQILRAKIEEMQKFCGLTITDSLGVDVTEGLIHYMKLGNKEWLQQKRKEMFIETVSTMDCELSGIREETFNELLEELE